MKLSCVIPCYNSEANIDTVLASLIKTLDERPAWDYEVVLVNDCSEDGTWRKIIEITSRFSRVVGVDLARNFGQANALMAGFSVSTGTHVVTFEDDGQSGAEYIWELIDLLDEDHDIACTRNVELPQRGLIRAIGRKINYFTLDHFLERPKEITPAIFFAAKRRVIDEMMRYRGPYPYIGGLILRSTSKIAQLDIRRNARLSGSSGYNLKKLTKLLLDGVITFSAKPLKLIGTAATILVIMLIAYGILSLCGVLQLMPLASLGALNTFLLLFVGLVILLSLAVIGEYLGRACMNENGKPQYIIREYAKAGHRLDSLG